MQQIRTTVVMPVALYERLKKQAKRRRWPIAHLTREVIAQHVEREERASALQRKQRATARKAKKGAAHG
jgi:hypothetical protein